MSFINNFSLEGKVALVTGAAYGIGFAMAEAMAMVGAKIAFNCRGQENMDKALKMYKEKGIIDLTDKNYFDFWNDGKVLEDAKNNFKEI